VDDTASDNLLDTKLHVIKGMVQAVICDQLFSRHRAQMRLVARQLDLHRETRQVKVPAEFEITDTNGWGMLTGRRKTEQ
jgi:hypothetical protein